METLSYQFASAPIQTTAGTTLCGVVGSGNLEVLFRPGEAATRCCVEVHTSARGFGDIWQAVLASFANTHAVGGLHIAIHDMGATPAVVSLRLAQALAELQGAPQ